MNIEELKQLITALGPAGEAVRETTILYIVIHFAESIIVGATILGGIVLCFKGVRKLNEKVIGIETETLIYSEVMDYGNAQVNAAYKDYTRRHQEIVNGRFSSFSKVKQEKIDELIKFLKEN